jgi:amino acid transporter
MKSDVLFEIFSFIVVIAIAGLGMVAVYASIMGALQKNRKQLVLGLACLLGAIVAAFIYLMFIALVFGKSC